MGVGANIVHLCEVVFVFLYVRSLLPHRHILISIVVHPLSSILNQEKRLRFASNASSFSCNGHCDIRLFVTCSGPWTAEFVRAWRATQNGCMLCLRFTAEAFHKYLMCADRNSCEFVWFYSWFCGSFFEISFRIQSVARSHV